MAYLQDLDNETYTTSVMDSNDTLCYGQKMTYIPTVEDYREAVGGYGTAFVTIGSVTTALLYLLFFHQAWFTYSNTHKVYRRHIYWLISIYPFVTLMSTLALVVPRAHQLCSAIKIVYMCCGVGHFADLTLLMYGSENMMLYELRDSPMQLSLPPLCCCLRCLPAPPTSRLRISLLKWMVWQMKWTQALYYVILYLITISKQSDGGASPRGPLVWLMVLNFSSFLTGSWAINIMAALSNEKLQRFRYRAKSVAAKVLVLTVKLQGVIFDVLAALRVFPCLAPMITPVVYQDTVENSVFLIEMLIFGLFSYFMYRLPEFKDYEEPVVPTTQSNEFKASVNQVEEQTATADPGSSGSESAYGSADSVGGKDSPRV